MPRKKPPPGYSQCFGVQCGAIFKTGTGAPSRTVPGVTLTSACSVQCRDQLNAAKAQRDKDPKAKAWQKQWVAGETGQANAKRCNDAANARRRVDPAMKLHGQLSVAVRNIWMKRLGTSDVCTILAKNTNFESPSALVAHLSATCRHLGVLQGEGSIDHIIAQAWYDFNDPDEVKRCWDPSNVRVVASNSENKKKHKCLDAELLQSVSPSAFPKAFSRAIFMAAALKDGGKDLYSQYLLTKT